MPETGNESTWKLNVHDPILEKTFTSTQVSSFHWADTVSVDVTIGAYDTLGDAVVGDIDIAAIGMWRRKLSTKEILQLQNQGQGLNFGAPNFTKITRVYWDSEKRRNGDLDTF